MNENRIEGAEKVALGKFESAAGEALGDSTMEARGGVRELAGHIQEAAGSVQDVLGRVASGTVTAVSKATETYGRVAGAAQDISRRVEEEPYLAVGVAAVIGLLLGLLLWGRGPKIIYVKPRVSRA
ncbi:MAG: CsbD family protein [Caulobacteraceae bacterium]